MRRRLATVVVPALLLIAAPATTAAQAPPDERSAAQAFADAALRAKERAEVLEDELDGVVGRLSRCEERVLNRVPERRQEDADLLVSLPGLHQLGRLVDPVFMQMSMELHGVQTADPALRAGRTAIRRIRRLYHAAAELPDFNACTALRASARGGFETTDTLRAARRGARRFEALQLQGIDERLSRAAARMGELGVSKEGVEAFGGGSPEADSTEGQGRTQVAPRG